MDRLEQYRPTSTGLLIQRALPQARQHLFQRKGPSVQLAHVRDGSRETWILHTRGESMPTGARAANVQALLLDGSWQAVGVMLPQIAGWGRRVRLPTEGMVSRYWLRDAGAAGRLSTAEALIVLLEGLGEVEAAASLRVQFELHVFAGLLARGKRADAQRFLEQSPITSLQPALIARLLRNRYSE